MNARALAASGLALLFAACAATSSPEPAGPPTGPFASSWSSTVDRVWIGPEYWANRLQDWSIRNGRLHCASPLPWRTLHHLTRRLSARDGTFEATVRVGFEPGESGSLPENAFAGFLIGAGSADLDYRSACLVQSAPGPDGGLLAGIDGAGRLLLHSFETPLDPPPATEIPFGTIDPSKLVDVTLSLAVAPDEVRLVAIDSADGSVLDSWVMLLGDIATFHGIVHSFASANLAGNVALVAHPGPAKKAARFWFDDWRMSGDRLDVHEERAMGSILSAQHTLSRGVMHMTAQLFPFGEDDSPEVLLQVHERGRWKAVAASPVIVPGYTATFRLEDWPTGRDVPYRLVHRVVGPHDQPVEHEWQGTVRRDPVAKNEVVLAAFTGNHNVRHGFARKNYPWSEETLWFPHADVVQSVAWHEPDLLFFSGDQVYEGASPTRAEKRDRPELDYLYKWYLWCWAFRDLTKDVACVSIPDDHDVYQGNIWGQGGRATKVDNEGGYVMPADWVRMVERTQTSNLPDPAHPEPIRQGIGTYYTSLLVGGIDFAILEDRKFKSGCAGLVEHGGPRPDHIVDPDFDPRFADFRSAELLGRDQEHFLRAWAGEWKGVVMKAALSQTVFANVATLHGARLDRLVADLDSNGWPQSGRNRALAALRIGSAFMVGGDQHLSTIVHHGIDTWDDAGWSFTVPSIANFYPRAWVPFEPGLEREPGSPEFTGRHLDGLGNHVTVFAATNPTPQGREPAALHDKMPGYGIVRFDKASDEITMECWPRWADPAHDPQYPGWPRTIHWFENDGREVVAWLPTIRLKSLRDPVVEVYDEETDELLYARRFPGRDLRLGVFGPGTYTVLVNDDEGDRVKLLRGLQAGEADDVVIELDL